MPTIEELNAKQQELKSTEQELMNIKNELTKKSNELENAKLANEDEKSAFIKELIDEIKALREEKEAYDEKFALIQTELNNLRANFNSTEQTTTEQTTAGQTTTEQTTAGQTTTGQTTTEQTTAGQTTTEQTTAGQTTTGQTTTEQTTAEQTTTEQTTAGQTTTGQTTTEQTTAEQTTTEQTTAEQTTTEQTNNQPDIQSNSQDNIKLDNYEGYDKALSQLIFEIDGCIQTAKYKKGLNKSGKETLKTAKAKLEQYKDIISGKQNSLKNEYNEKKKLNEKNPDKASLTLSITASEINELKNRRLNGRKQIENDIKEGQMGKSSNTAPWPNQSLEQVKKGNRVDNHHIEYDSRLNEALNDAAFLRIIDNNQDKAREFLQAIANNSLSESQITFCKIHMTQLSPYFDQYGLTNHVNRCIQAHGGHIETVQGNPRQSIDYSNMDLGEAFQQGGLVGMFEKGLSLCKNMTPGQRNTWKSVAVLGGVAAGIFGLYKFFTNDKMGFWGKALTTGGVILGSQMLTGEGPISLFQKLLTGGFTNEYLQDKFGYSFGDAVSGVQNSGIESSNTIAPAMYSMMIFNSSTKKSDIDKMTQSFKNNENRKIFYQQACTTLSTKYGAQSLASFQATFSDQFDEEKWKNRLASFGVTDATAPNESIYGLANNAAMNGIILNKFKEENGLIVTNEKALNEYIQNKKNNNEAIDVDELNTHINKDGKDWFKIDNKATNTQRPEDIKFKETLVNQIDNLALNDTKKTELKSAMERFYDNRTIDSKPLISDFSLKIDNGLLILKSRGYETKIKLDTNEIVDLGTGIRFTDISELLNVADLTNKILESQKGKVAVDYPPFEYKTFGKMGRGIYFNDADNRGLNFDTRVLSGGWGGTIGKIDTLSNHPKEYAEYLSKRRMEINKPSSK